MKTKRETFLGTTTVRSQLNQARRYAARSVPVIRPTGVQASDHILRPGTVEASACNCIRFSQIIS